MKYSINTRMTVSVRTVVEADSPEEALELAGERQMMATGFADPRDEWVTELDGEPQLEVATVEPWSSEERE